MIAGLRYVDSDLDTSGGMPCFRPGAALDKGLASEKEKKRIRKTRAGIANASEDIEPERSGPPGQRAHPAYRNWYDDNRINERIPHQPPRHFDEILPNWPDRLRNWDKCTLGTNLRRRRSPQDRIALRAGSVPPKSVDQRSAMIVLDDTRELEVYQAIHADARSEVEEDPDVEIQ